MSPRALWILHHAKTREEPPAGHGVEDSPALALASGAVRARETAELALETGELACELTLEPTIYEASAVTLLAVLRSAPKKTTSPSSPPGALAHLELGGAWSELGARGANLALLVTPEVLLGDDDARE